MHDELDGVGDHLTGDQRCPHALVAHRDPVGDGNGREGEPDPSGSDHALLGIFGEPRSGYVARGYLVAGRNHADLGLFEVLVGQPHGAEHGPGAGLGRTDGYVLRADFD